MIALDVKTGKVLWETPGIPDLKLSHSSIMPIAFGSEKIYLYAALGGLVGVDSNGTLRFLNREWKASVLAPSPLFDGNDSVYMTAGYGAGAVWYNLTAGPDLTLASSYLPAAGLSSEQQTPIFHNGFYYGIMPKDGDVYRNQLVCADRGGKIRWASGLDHQYGLGPYLAVGNRLVIMGEEGTLSLVELDPNVYKPLSRIKLFDGIDAWGPIAAANGKILVRTSTSLYCISVPMEEK
jgi:outer membrane protein assembly factor BamB